MVFSVTGHISVLITILDLELTCIGVLRPAGTSRGVGALCGRAKRSSEAAATIRPRKEAPAVCVVLVVSAAQAEHGAAAGRVGGGEAPRDAAHGDQDDSDAWNGNSITFRRAVGRIFGIWREKTILLNVVHIVQHARACYRHLTHGLTFPRHVTTSNRSATLSLLLNRNPKTSSDSEFRVPNLRCHDYSIMNRADLQGNAAPRH